MKATYGWIKDYVPDFDGSVEEMCERFTMSGTEVEYFRETDGGDYMIEFAVTSNRVDCLGVLGLARELAAVCGLELKMPETDVEPFESEADVADAASVELIDVHGCRRFTAQVIEGVTVKPSPDWMQQRLTAIGLRPVNNIVDITNYVMFEMNQPYHAFDLDKLKDGKIIVRGGSGDEKLVAINDREYTLTKDMTLITDPSGPIAIAGVMGGLPTEVSDATTNILLETAAFERVGIRRTSRSLGLASDASFRFERGVDDQTTAIAARRCARMICELAGGKVRRGIVDVNETSRDQRVIPFRPAEVRRICGIDVPWARCREIFEALEFVVEGGENGEAEVTVPTYRHDLAREIDLVEEVIRVHGLEHLPLETGMPVMTVKTRKDRKVRRIVKDTMVGSGFSETLTTSFLPEDEAAICFFAKTAPVTISNAMRADENALRQSLLPSLLRVRKTNQDRDNRDVRLMESTVVYLQHDEGAIPEHLSIVGFLADAEYRAGRGAFEKVGEVLGLELTFAPLDDVAGAVLEKDGGATIFHGEKVVGYLGRPTRALLDRFDLRESPYYAEFRLDVLEQAAELTPTYRPLSKFPPVKRDLAIVIDEARTWGEVRSTLDGLSLDDLEAIEFFDEYRGKQVGKGKKSLAFSLTYRSHERTLTGEEVDASQARAVKALEDAVGAQVRQ